MSKDLKIKHGFTLAEVFSVHPKGGHKHGFTLAEVLITLGIIGVVAAMTLPTLIQKHQKKTWVEQLKKSVTTIENGFKMALAEDGVDSLFDTELFSPCIGTVENIINGTVWMYGCLFGGNGANIRDNRAKFMQNLGKYLKITKFVDGNNAVSGKDFNYDIYYLGNKSDKEQLFYGSVIGVMLTDGVLVIFSTALAIRPDSICAQIKELGGGYCNSLGSVTIDVNGQKGPNTFGRDVFIFELADNGKLYPLFGKDGAILGNLSSNWAEKGEYWKSSEAASYGFDCNPKNPVSEGSGCAARIIENGWVMDY